MKLEISSNHDCIHETGREKKYECFRYDNQQFDPGKTTRFHSVMVIISVFESGDPSSILGETFSFLLVLLDRAEFETTSQNVVFFYT
jgi:hypothetical protein